MNMPFRSHMSARAQMFTWPWMIALLCTLSSAAWVLPQQAPPARPRPASQETPTFKVQSNLVVVDVTVRDNKGNLVKDLRREDFTVSENGVPQELVTFSLQDIPTAPLEPLAAATPGAPAPEAAAPVNPPINLGEVPRAERKNADLDDKRLIIMFFDLTSLKNEDLIRSLDTAEEFVENKSGPHDLIAIATYGSSLQLPQDFTNDREILLDVLKRLDPDELEAMAEEEALLPEEEEDVAEEDQDLPEEIFVPDSVQFNIFNTDRRLSALESLAKVYREFPERKSLIYFCGGVKTTGVENQAQIRSTVDAANQANLTIYTVDSRGLTALPPGGLASMSSPKGKSLFTGDSMRKQFSKHAASQETLTTLANDTGGESFQEVTDLAPVFDKVLSDTQAYYVLGYYSKNLKEDGRFRKIRVEVKRPNVKLQHRPGYFASKIFEKLTQSEREKQMEEALGLARPFTELPFILQADYFKESGANSLVPISLQLGGEGIKFEEKGEYREAQFEFLARVSNIKGKVAGITRDTVDIRLPIGKAERIRAGQILYGTGFELRPGKYNLKFLIRDNGSGKLGSFEQQLSVPPLTGRSLQTSSVILGSRLVETRGDSQGIQQKGPGKDLEMPGMKRDPLVIGDRRIVPSIGNVFLGRQTLYVYFEVYGATEDFETRKPSLETYLALIEGRSRVRESQPYHVQEWTRSEDGIATVAMAVPLRGLRSGSYTLQIHVRDAVTDANLFRRLPVEIH